MKKLLLASTAATLFAVPVLAQEAPVEGSASTGRQSPCGEDACVIVVLGEGLPQTPGMPAYSTVRIDRDQLVTAPSGRIEDVLANVAGFQQFRRSDSRSANPSAQGATLRALGGNAASRALVLLDGVPMSDPFFGYIPYSAIAPERLAGIQVTRGGGSGPFGAGALTGTIELESADAATLGPVQASALANMRGDTELSASIAPELGTGFAVIHGRWDRGDGFYTTPEDQRVPASSRASFDGWSLGGRVVQQLGDAIEVQARFLAFEDQRTLRFEGADSSIDGRDVSLRLVSRGPWEFDVIGYGQWRNFTNIVVSSTRFVPVLDQKDTPASGIGGKMEVRPPLGAAHTLRIGADYRRSEGSLFEDAFSAFTGALRENRFAGGVNTDLGLFVEHDWQAGALTLTGGVRADRYTIRDGYYRAQDADGIVLRDDEFADRSDWEATWRAGALYRASDVVAVRGAYYTGFRLPTLNELYRPFVVFPVVTEANANLAPERLEGWELGVDLTPAPGARIAATYFDNRIEDAIANVTLAPDLRQRRNLDAIEASGLELAAGFDSGSWSFDGTIVLTDAQVVGAGSALALDGNRPPQVPEFLASASLAYVFDAAGRIAATLRHVGAQFEGDQEDDILPSATTLDLFAQYPLMEGLSLVGRVENAFDATVITRNQGGSLDIGAPRTVWLGLRWGY